MRLFISTTARQTGFGRAPHKRVVGLIPAERDLVRNGALVVYDSGRKVVPGTKQDFYPRALSEFEARCLKAVLQDIHVLQ